MGLECGISTYMGKQVDNPVDQFIEIAPDSPTQQSIVPQMKSGIAIYPAEGKEYQRFVRDKNIKKFSAMRSKRA